MANGAESHSVRRSRGLLTFCAHPAFSALLAVAFAALLSGGSLLIPPDLVARMLNGSGSAVAALPLGFTARATISIAGALAGVALGLSLARRLTLSLSAETPGQSSPDIVQRRRPIDVAEDVGEEGIAPIEFANLAFPDAPPDTQPTVAQPALTVAIEEVEWYSPEPSLADLGLMQLTARLAASLAERRKQRAANERARPPAHPPAPGGLEPSGAEEAARAIADFFAPASGEPAYQEPTREVAASDGQNGTA